MYTWGAQTWRPRGTELRGHRPEGAQSWGEEGLQIFSRTGGRANLEGMDQENYSQFRHYFKSLIIVNTKNDAEIVKNALKLLKFSRGLRPLTPLGAAPPDPCYSSAGVLPPKWISRITALPVARKIRKWTGQTGHDPSVYYSGTIISCHGFSSNSQTNFMYFVWLLEGKERQLIIMVQIKLIKKLCLYKSQWKYTAVCSRLQHIIMFLNFDNQCCLIKLCTTNYDIITNLRLTNWPIKGSLTDQLKEYRPPGHVI